VQVDPQELGEPLGCFERIPGAQEALEAPVPHEYILGVLLQLGFGSRHVVFLVR
jgi:hypothetical protein